MNLYPLAPMSSEFISEATRVEKVGAREDGHVAVTAYHFPFDPDTGVPFRTVVLVATDDRHLDRYGVYSLAGRLWESRMFQASSVRGALKRLQVDIDNPDKSR
ncbi:hypothetical protein SEA_LITTLEMUNCHKIN_56 [Gordonia phage LittleMunchkin]|nr:hypothetical protein SEA_LITTLEMUNCHKIN_56 [Gordonia phage LittleMunchkin]